MGSSEMDKQAKEKEPKTPPPAATATATATTQVYLSNSEPVILCLRQSYSHMMSRFYLFIYLSKKKKRFYLFIFIFFRSLRRILELVLLILTGLDFRLSEKNELR